MRQDVVNAARAWIGTPYVHQQATKGAGTDCLGLLRGVWSELYGEEPEEVPAYTMDWSEPQGDERLLRAGMRHFTPKDLSDQATGDVLLFRMRDGAIAKHLGIQSEIGPGSAFIHAYSRVGVVESPLSHPWWRRIIARFAFPQETI